jgi:hypothetical protein
MEVVDDFRQLINPRAFQLFQYQRSAISASEIFTAFRVDLQAAHLELRPW